MALAIAVAVVPWARGYGQLLDRVVASVGNVGITERDVTMECRFESFLEGRMPADEYDAQVRKASLDRLISQALLQGQLSASARESPIGTTEAKEVLQGARDAFASPSEYESAVRKLGMTEAQIVERVEKYQRMLQVVEARFQPVAAPTSSEVQQYYRSTFVPEYLRLHAGPAPALSAVEPQIRQILTQRNINRLLSDWLGQMRSTQRVKIRVPEAAGENRR